MTKMRSTKTTDTKTTTAATKATYSKTKKTTKQTKLVQWQCLCLLEIDLKRRPVIARYGEKEGIGSIKLFRRNYRAPAPGEVCTGIEPGGTSSCISPAAWLFVRTSETAILIMGIIKSDLPRRDKISPRTTLSIVLSPILPREIAGASSRSSHTKRLHLTDRSTRTAQQTQTSHEVKPLFNHFNSAIAVKRGR